MKVQPAKAKPAINVRPTTTSRTRRSSTWRLLKAWLASTTIHVGIIVILALIVHQAAVGPEKLVLKVADPLEPESLASVDLTTPVEIAELSDSAEPTDAPADPAAMNESLQVTPVSMVPTESSVSTFATTLASEIVSEDLRPETSVNIGPRLQRVISRRQELPMFQGRSGSLRQQLLRKYGGTPMTEEAVARGLAWLIRNQMPDGSWSLVRPYPDPGMSENSVAATSMALLAFLGDGQTHQSGKYAKQINKALDLLISSQRPDGFFGMPLPGNASFLAKLEPMYGQAMASLVVCEAYGMTGDSRLRPHAELAVQFAARAQSANGGWRYQPGMLGDTSVTGWYLVMFESAKSAGIEYDEAVLQKIDRFLNTVAVNRGSAYAYMPGRRAKPSMTAVGLLCRQYLGWEYEHPALRRGVEVLATDFPFRMIDEDVYYWYYATQVFHHDGGLAWEAWNNAMRVQLPAAQVREGKQMGSWGPAGGFDGRMGGRLYSTCMAIYCLEVYYRHMPIYRMIDPEEENKFPL